MKKVVAGLSVAGAAALLGLGTATAAQAYPDTNPKGTEVNSSTVTPGSTSSTSPSALPSTGGPNETLLFGGAALLVAGGASIVVARRRQTN